MKMLLLTTFLCFLLSLASAQKVGANPGDVIRYVPSKITFSLAGPAGMAFYKNSIMPHNPNKILSDCVSAVLSTFYSSPWPLLPVPVTKVLVYGFPDSNLAEFIGDLPIAIITLGVQKMITLFGRLLPGELANEFSGLLDCAVSYAFLPEATPPEVRMGLAGAFQIYRGHRSAFWAKPGTGTFEEGHEYSGQFFDYLFRTYPLASMSVFYNMLKAGENIQAILYLYCGRQTLETLWEQYKEHYAKEL